MFLHHNGMKLDFTHILDPNSQIIFKDKKGHNTRLWEDPLWMIDRVGRDVEKMLWEDSMRNSCDVGLGRWANVCNAMRRFGRRYSNDGTVLILEQAIGAGPVRL
jgi:hypothetical protein